MLGFKSINSSAKYRVSTTEQSSYREFVSEYSIPWARFSAFALTFATPIMLVYLFAQRYTEGTSRSVE
jgi:ABC-type maltose transport system permease subunit